MKTEINKIAKSVFYVLFSRFRPRFDCKMKLHLHFLRQILQLSYWKTVEKLLAEFCDGQNIAAKQIGSLE